MRSTLTSKGQVTIPKAIRDYLGLSAGSQVAFEVDLGGKATVRAVEPAAKHRQRSRAVALRGALKTDRGTDALMELLRNYDADAHDPGFGSSSGKR